MATKTDFYNRIISSLQSEITELKTIVSELQKEMEEMWEVMKKAAEPKTSAKPIPVESSPATLSLKTLPRKEVEILISKMKTVCDEAIKANHENYVEMFAMQSELNSLRENIETAFLSTENFRDYQSAQEVRYKCLEEKIEKRFSFLTINKFRDKIDHPHKCFWNLRSICRLLHHINLQWLISVVVSLFICGLASYLLYSIS